MRYLVETTGTNVNIRSGPGTQFKILRTYADKGTQVEVTQLKDGWYYIPGRTAWISAKYVKIVKNLETQPSKPTSSTPPKTTPAPPKIPIPNTAIYDEGNRTEIYVPQGGGKPTPVNEVLDLTDIQNNQQFPKVSKGANGVQIFDYEIDLSYLQDNMRTIKENMNILHERPYVNIREELHDRFNRFKTAFPGYHLSKSFSHVFFTRPDMNLLDRGSGKEMILDINLQNDPMYYYLYKNQPKILLALTRHLTTAHDFHPYLSNAASSFEVPDEFIKTIEHGETFTGYKVQYGKNNIESNSAGSFSVNYHDDQDFTIYKTHKAWTEYISRVFRGETSPFRDHVVKKILDYACSVYYFICGPDGETILFWSKYFGVFPTNTPASASSWSKGTNVKLPEFSINYAYAFKEDFSPLSLAEFNFASRGKYEYKRTYENQLYGTGRTLSGSPFIESTKDAAGHYVYKLRFRRADNLES